MPLNCTLDRSSAALHLQRLCVEFRARFALSYCFYIGLAIGWGEGVDRILCFQETQGIRLALAQAAFHFKCADEIDPSWWFDIFVHGSNRDTWKPQCIEESAEAAIHGSHAVSNAHLLAQQIDFSVYAQD